MPLLFISFMQSIFAQYLQQIKKIMKTTAKLLMSTILLAGLATGAKAQSTALASTTATLITPISISKDVDMNFGQIASSAAQGTVVLNYLDQGTISGGLTSPDGGATAKTAAFTVTGEATSAFSITIPTSILLTNSVGGNTLVVSDFIADAGAASALVAGTKVIKVGATLTVPANTVAGTYTNTGDVTNGLFVTVNYN
jgi:hypothetical protein